MKFLSFSLNIASLSNNQFCLKRRHKGSESCLLQGLVAVFCPRTRLSFTIRLITAKLQDSLETMWQLFPPTDRFDNWWSFGATRSMILDLDTNGGSKMLEVFWLVAYCLFHVRNKKDAWQLYCWIFLSPFLINGVDIVGRRESFTRVNEIQMSYGILGISGSSFKETDAF